MNLITEGSYFPVVPCGTYKAKGLTKSSLLFPLTSRPRSRCCSLALLPDSLLAPVTLTITILLFWSASHRWSGVEAALRIESIPSVPFSQQPPPSDAPKAAAASLGNGTEIKARLRLDGHGELTIKNGTGYDAIVNLVEPQAKRVVRSFYVQSHKEFVEKSIAPGTYEIYFSTGKGWDAKSLSFQDDAIYGRFERVVQFSEREDPFTGKIEFRGYEVTLQAVDGGDVAACLPVDKQTFQKMMEQRTDSAKLE